MGRAAAIAYAREGADVAINYFPSEEPDARDVIAIIKEAGRIAVAIPGDLRDETFCKKLVSDAVQGLGVKRALATAILRIAEQGERDPTLLADAAFHELAGIQRSATR